MAVEPARPEQCRIEDIRPVGSCQHDYIGVAVEAIHLHQYLVQSLLPLVMPAAQAGAAVAADGIDLVHEDDAGRIAFGLVEQVTYTRGAHADEHLDELTAADGEERHAGLAGGGFGYQCFAAARRAYQEQAARYARAQGQEFLWGLEELH